MPVAARRLTAVGFVEPCLPTLAKAVPDGPQWAHEIKHDGFRMIARREGTLSSRHHAIHKWHRNYFRTRAFPWDTLAVEWAYTDESKLDYKGEPFETERAERWLLRCYTDSFGELPPWNEKV